MQRQSPPKHRHDGTSPLPLGMDWSPPPRTWAGRETVWPHDPRTGWSYCVTIPSWVVLAQSRDSEPVVFYRVLVGIQSPEGITTTRTVLRRFNDFLKLFAALKRVFPRKSIPPAPPKGLLRMKTRAMLEERRSSLEEWMGKVLSEIDLSRSAPIASFLELEAAARSSFQDESQHSSELDNPVNTVVSSAQVHPNSSSSLLAGTSSLTSDYGSDTAYEASEIGSPSIGRDNISEVGTEDLSLDDDLTSPIDKFVKYGMSNIDEGLCMGQAILAQLEGFPKHKLHARETHNIMENRLSNGNTSKSPPLVGDGFENLSLTDRSTIAHHSRKLSSESIGSDVSSQRGNEPFNSKFINSNGDGNVEFGGPKVLNTSGTPGSLDFELLNDVQLILPMDQRQKMNRVVTTMQRRLATAKTDMEDLISRLNQEITVKDYLATKLKDLEVELEVTKQKSKENLEQAIMIERERVTQMQWDMEELRQRSMEMELKLNSQQGQKLNTESTKASPGLDEDILQQQLDSTMRQLDDMVKQYQELEVKSKADIRVLVKEVKSLRSSQADLKQRLNQSIQEKSELEGELHQERQNSEQTRISWRGLLQKAKILHEQLEECKVNLLNETEDNLNMSLPDALDLIATSDNQISLLIAEVRQLAQADNRLSPEADTINLDDETGSLDLELRSTLASLLVANGILRKQVNSIARIAFNIKKSTESVDGGPS